MRRPSPSLSSICAAALLTSLACSGGEETSRPVASASDPAATSTTKPAEPTQKPSQEELVARGKSIYMANCIACHNVDPSKSGALGPEVHDASAELLEVRVLRGEYPAGYTPKRDTRAMVPMPHLEREMDALAAYLATYR